MVGFDFADVTEDLERFGASYQRVGDAFWNRDDSAMKPSNNGIAQERHVHAISKGCHSAISTLGRASNLEVVGAILGRRFPQDLINRIQALGLDDLSMLRSGKGEDIAQAILKICLESEVEELQNHAINVRAGLVGVKHLAIRQATSLFENLYHASVVREYKQDEIEDLSSYIMPWNVRVGGGVYGDVYRTELIRPGSTTPVEVAVKALQFFDMNLENAEKGKWEIRLRREIKVWKDLDHLNVLRLLGVVHNFKDYSLPSMVCPWMEGGTLEKHIRVTRTNITLRERFNLLGDILEGLAYLHSKSIIHGDLTNVNILISQNTAHISDFGLSEIIAEFVGTSYMTRGSQSGAVRWAGPELFGPTGVARPGEPGSRRQSKACDIWSLGCIIQEVMSGYIPYFDTADNDVVYSYKLQGISPNRPGCLLITDKIWDVITRCWRVKPEWRPEIGQVAKMLEEIRHGYAREELDEVFQESGLELD